MGKIFRPEKHPSGLKALDFIFILEQYRSFIADSLTLVTCLPILFFFPRAYTGCLFHEVTICVIPFILFAITMATPPLPSPPPPDLQVRSGVEGDFGG